MVNPLLSIKISAALLVVWVIFNTVIIFLIGVPENWVDSKPIVYGGFAFALSMLVFGLLGRKGTPEMLGKWKSFPNVAFIVAASFIFQVVMKIVDKQ